MWLRDEDRFLVSGAGMVWGGHMNDGEMDSDARNIALTAREVQEERCNMVRSDGWLARWQRGWTRGGRLY